MSTVPSSTVLLVDDSPLGRKSLSAPLEGLGYNLLQAGDGQEALRIAAQSRPDLILMDVRMPGMDGIEACRQLRLNPALAEIPIILVTGHDDTTRLQGLEAGADDYLIKPFDPAEFRARVKTITRLNRYRHVYTIRAKFEQLVELSPDGILLVDTEGRVRLANPAAATLLGVTHPDDLMRTDLLSFVAAGEQMDWAEHLAGALGSDQKTKRLDGTIRGRDGVVRSVEAFTCAFLGEGEPTAQLILRDVTYRKESEAAIRKLNQELESRVEERTSELALEMREHQESEAELSVSQQRLQSALEAAQQGLWEWDLPNDKLLVDDRWKVLHDAVELEMEQGLPGWEDCVLPEDRGTMRRSLHHSLSQSLEGWFEAEYRVKRRTPGGPRWILVRGRVRERDANGRPVRMIGTAQDLTARKELETELLRAKDRAEQATRAKSEFLANMSHEIRTPLNAVLGFCELLERDITEPRHMEYLRAINAGGRSLLSIINDILDLSKIEAGRLTLQPEPMDIGFMCREIRGIFMEKSRQKGLEFILDVSPQVPTRLLVDAVRLRQVLFNLIGNSIKFTRAGQVTLAVHMDAALELSGSQGAAVQDRSVIFTVQDTGIGIPESDQATIFEAFRQKSGQSTREFGGTGLGLTISRRLVEMMEGVITVESTPGVGTTFSVRLPATLVDDEESGSAGTLVGEAQEPAWEFEEAMVLVVDDNRLNRELVMAVLRDSPLTLMEASSGEEALQMAQTHQPDVVLLDLRMPGMDGRAVAERMRGDTVTSWIPILLLTAAATMKEAQAVQQIGVDGFLTKPVRRQSLLKELRRFLPTRPVSGKEREGSAAGEAHADQEAPASAPVRIHASAAPLLLRELIPRLKGPMLAEWKEARESLMVSRIESLANQLKALGGTHSLPSLVELGNEMMVAVQSYDVERMLTSMEKYPACIDELEQNVRAGLAMADGE